MDTIVIDNPTQKDVDTLWKWGEENPELWGDSESKWYPKDSLKKWIKNPREDILLVARIDGVLAGMCMTYTLTDWAYCAGLYVDSPYRKRGIAKLLVDKTVDKLKNYGIEAIVFLVEQNNYNGMQFYNKIRCKSGFMFKWMYKMIPKEGK